MRICDLTTLYIDGGAGGVNTYLLEKARYFADHRGVKQHTIIVPGARDTEQRLFDSTLYTVRSPCFVYNPHHRILTHYRQITRLLTMVRPDLIEVDCTYLLGHWARRAMRQTPVPLVGFYHAHLPSFYARPLTQRFGNVVATIAEASAWRYMAYCMAPLDKVLVASQDIYARLVTTLATKVEQVPLGVNMELFKPRPLQDSTTRHTRPMILYVGRLSQEKDLPVLFEAFRLLNQWGTYQLCLVGDGPLRCQTERFVQTTPHTTYVGMIPYGTRLAELYATADVLALPSRNETFGLTILEALAAGVPVVAANQGGPTDLLQPHVGALATPGDPVDFADKLARVLADCTKAEQCRAYVTEHFSWSKTFLKLLTIYENLLARGTTSPEGL